MIVDAETILGIFWSIEMNAKLFHKIAGSLSRGIPLTGAFLYFCHLGIFFSQNGICLNGETGRIAGNQSRGAGALPMEVIPLASLDLLRPFSSDDNFLSSIIVLITFTYLIISFFLNKNKSTYFAKSYPYWILIMAIIAVPSIECSFSCELILTHINMQKLYTQKIEDPGYDNSIKITKHSTENAYEIEGSRHEATCRSFILSIKSPKREISEAWFGQSGTIGPSNADRSIIFNIIKDQYQINVDSTLNVSAYPFLERKTNDSEISKYSVIGCLEWRHMWYDQLP